MLLGDDAPSWSLAIGKGEKDYPLVAVQTIPNGLVRIRGLRQGEVDGRRRRVVRRRSVQQLIEVMSQAGSCAGDDRH